MNDLTTTGADRRLLAEVSRWAHANGWEVRSVGWVNKDRTIAVDPVYLGFILRIWNRQNGCLTSQDIYAAYTTRVAVDLLAALGVLPVHFSSAYAAGIEDGGELVSNALAVAVTR